MFKRALLFLTLFCVSAIEAQIQVAASVDHLVPWTSDNRGNIRLTVTGGVSPYTYTWTPGPVYNQDLTNVAAGSYTVRVKANNGVDKYCYYTLGYKTQWLNFFGTKFRNDSLMSNGVTGYTNRCALSKNTLPANTNGWAEYVHRNSATPYVIGFLDSTSIAAQPSGSDYDFSFHVTAGNALYAYIAGSFYSLGSVVEGDVLKIERVGSTYYMRKNLTQIYTLAAPAGKKLKIKGQILNTPLVNIGVSFNDSSNIDRLQTVYAYVDNIKTDGIDSVGRIIPDIWGGREPLTYKWMPGNITTRNLTNAAKNSYTFTVKDANNDSLKYYYNLGYRIDFKNLYGTGTTFVNDTLQAHAASTPSGSSSGAGTNELRANGDGWGQLVIQDFQAPYVLGFSDSIRAANKGDINDIVYAFHVTTGNALYSWSGGSFTYLGTTKKGDVMSVHRIGSTYYIKKNNVNIHNAAANASKTLRLKMTLNSNSFQANMGASFNTPQLIAGIQKDPATTTTSFDGSATISKVSGTKLIWSDGSTESSRTNLAPGNYTVYVHSNNQTSYTEMPVKIGIKPTWNILTNISVENDSIKANNPDSLGISVSDNLSYNNRITWQEGLVSTTNHDFSLGFIGVADTTGINPISQNSLIKRRIDSCYWLFNRAKNNLLPTTGADSILNLGTDFSNIHLLRMNNGKIRLLLKGSSYKTLYYYKAGDVIKIGRDVSGNIYLSVNERVFHTHIQNTNTQFLYPVIVTTPVTVKIKKKTVWAGDLVIPNCSPPANGFYAVIPSGPAGIVCAGVNSNLSAQLQSVTFGGPFGPYYTNVTSPPVTYMWQPTNQVSQNITVNPLSTQNYMVSASYNGCTYNNNITVNVTNLSANAGPDHFIPTFPSGALNIGSNPTAAGGVSPYTYNWTSSPSGLTLNNSTVSNPLINSISSSFGTSTVYNVNVVVTDAAGCTANDNLNVFDISGTNSVHYAILNKSLDAGYYNSINNGASNMFYFAFNEEYYAPTGTNLTYIVYDNDGAAQTLPSLVENIGDNRFALNVSSLTVGSYYKIYVYNQKKEVWQGRIKIN